MSCPFAHLDGAYVLGALSASERQDYERHLATCDDCSRRVRELAGLPGLLARVDPSVIDASSDPPVPPTLLPSLALAVDRRRRRRRFLALGVLAASVVVAVGLTLAVVRPADAPAGQADAPAGQAMQPEGEVPVSATLALEPVTWGTRLDLACTYEPDGYEDDRPATVTYGLFVHTRDGRTQQVGTWRAPEGKTLRLTAATAALRGDIVSVEIRTASGRSVLALRT